MRTSLWQASVRRALPIVYLLVCVQLTACSQPQARSVLDYEELRGSVWEGEASQPNSEAETRYMVALTFLADARAEISAVVVEVDYPDLGCGGNWTHAGEDTVEPPQTTMLENLEYGLDGCVTGSTVRGSFLDDEGTIELVWLFPEIDESEWVTATMSQTE